MDTLNRYKLKNFYLKIKEQMNNHGDVNLYDVVSLHKKYFINDDVFLASQPKNIYVQRHLLNVFVPKEDLVVINLYDSIESFYFARDPIDQITLRIVKLSGTAHYELLPKCMNPKNKRWIQEEVWDEIDKRSNALSLKEFITERKILKDELYKICLDYLTSKIDRNAPFEIEDRLRNTFQKSVPVGENGMITFGIYRIDTYVDFKGEYEFSIIQNKIDSISHQDSGNNGTTYLDNRNNEDKTRDLFFKALVLEVSD